MSVYSDLEKRVLRLVAAWEDYRKTDSGSGLMHIEHAVCNLGFLLQFIEEDTGLGKI